MRLPPAPTKLSLCHKTADFGEGTGALTRGLWLRRSALHTHNILVFKGQQGLAPSTLAAFTHEFDVESPSVWRDLGKNPWELEKAKNGPSGDFMIPGELPVDAATVDVSEGFSGTIAIGQAELKDHYGLSGRCASTHTHACFAQLTLRVFTAAAWVLERAFRIYLKVCRF